MSNYNSIEKIISAEILRTNEDNLIANKICNTSFAGDIKNAGDSVTFIGLNDPAVGSYNGTVSYEEIDDNAIKLNIDQEKWNLGLYADQFFEDNSMMVHIAYNGYGSGDEAFQRKQSRYFC